MHVDRQPCFCPSSSSGFLSHHPCVPLVPNVGTDPYKHPARHVPEYRWKSDGIPVLLSMLGSGEKIFPFHGREGYQLWGWTDLKVFYFTSNIQVPVQEQEPRQGNAKASGKKHIAIRKL